MSIDTDQKKIEEILSRGVEEIYPKKKTLEDLLLSGKKIRLYVGVDPTGKDLHIGHAIQFRKLKQFQELGHEVILLIGSFTAMIGDPTDKGAARKQLTKKEVLANAATYKRQAGKILRFTGKNPVKIMFNDKWLSKMNFSDVLELSSHFTVQQMSERDMFAKRMRAGKPVYLHEFMYPLMQGYDSVAMNVDLEIGGNDQMFNMLAGRTLMKSMKGKGKCVMTLRLLTNDEGKKMSKSEGGFVALTDKPEEMYGKIMAMSDDVILTYFEIATDVPLDEIEGMKLQLEKGTNPRDLKARLAREIVTIFHDAASAEQAEKHFDSVFRSKEIPDDMPEYTLSAEIGIIDALVQAELVSSKSEARRMIQQKAVKIDGVVVEDVNMILAPKTEMVLQRGKRKFARLK